MRLKDIVEAEDKKGTYAGVHFSEDTKDRIEKFIKENNIPNGVPRDKLHTTIIYSRKHLPNYEPQGELQEPWIGKPLHLDVWKSQKTENTEPANCLVLEYECEECVDRHEYLMKEHGATYDFDEYKTHVTLSYDIGDMSLKDIDDPETIGDLEIVEEYHEDLNLNWAKDNT